MAQLLDPPQLKGVLIPYHVTPAPRLLRVTYDKLESVGFARSAFGVHSGATIGTKLSPSTATALLTFSSFTQERLPPSAGGSNADAPFTPTKATSILMSAVSPGRGGFERVLEDEANVAGSMSGSRSALQNLPISPIASVVSPTSLSPSRIALRSEDGSEASVSGHEGLEGAESVLADAKISQLLTSLRKIAGSPRMRECPSSPPPPLSGTDHVAQR
jgi:hypothetical protein